MTVTVESTALTRRIAGKTLSVVNQKVFPVFRFVTVPVLKLKQSVAAVSETNRIGSGVIRIAQRTRLLHVSCKWQIILRN
jgi:hypothetical protein